MGSVPLDKRPHRHGTMGREGPAKGTLSAAQLCGCLDLRVPAYETMRNELVCSQATSQWHFV